MMKLCKKMLFQIQKIRFWTPTISQPSAFLLVLEDLQLSQGEAHKDLTTEAPAATGSHLSWLINGG